MHGIDQDGMLIEGIKDPQGGEELRALASAVVGSPSAATVAPLLRQYFGEELGGSAAAAEAIAGAVDALDREGTAAVLAQFREK